MPSKAFKWNADSYINEKSMYLVAMNADLLYLEKEIKVMEALDTTFTLLNNLSNGGDYTAFKQQFDKVPKTCWTQQTIENVKQLDTLVQSKGDLVSAIQMLQDSMASKALECAASPDSFKNIQTPLTAVLYK